MSDQLSQKSYLCHFSPCQELWGRRGGKGAPPVTRELDPAPSKTQTRNLGLGQPGRGAPFQPLPKLEVPALQKVMQGTYTVAAGCCWLQVVERSPLAGRPSPSLLARVSWRLDHGPCCRRLLFSQQWQREFPVLLFPALGVLVGVGWKRSPAL